MILFLDTISPKPKFILIHNNKIIDSIHILDENGTKISDSIHSKFLLFQKKNNFLNNLNHLVVCTGPGSYTSLRVGISFMLGLSFSKKIPICGLTGTELLSKSILKHDFENTILIICSANKQNFICIPFNKKKYEYIYRKINNEYLIDNIDLSKYTNCISNFILSDELKKITSKNIQQLQYKKFEENFILNLFSFLKLPLN